MFHLTKMEKFSRLTLGTAQLGMNYGIANVNGKPKKNTAYSILNYSWKNGINTYDTAPVYGNSEKIIGNFFSEKSKNEKKNLNIISKYPGILEEKVISWKNLYTQIKDRIIRSLNNLKIKTLPIYLLHRFDDLFINNGIIIECLKKIKNEGLINHIGVSVYHPTEVKYSLRLEEIEVIEVPINIFDQRLINLGLLDKLRKNNYTIFGRSIFLQGLFFLDPEKIPRYLKIARKPLMQLRNISKEYNIDIAELALLFVRDLPQITSIIVGTENLQQLKENIEISKSSPLKSSIRKKILKEFSNLPEKLLNPSKWNKQL